MKKAVLLLPFLLMVACVDTPEPRPQWLVVVRTNATIPLMGDRLRVELLDGHGQPACESCRRETPVFASSSWPVSFGIASPPDSREVYVQVQLYREDRWIAPSVPNAGVEGLQTTLDFLGELPPLHGGINEVGVHLTADCLGIPVEKSSSEFKTCSTEGSNTAPLKLGLPIEDFGNGGIEEDWGLRPEPCPDSAINGMVCIPGGLFFVGSTQAPVPFKSVDAVSFPERLIYVPTFLMDPHEVTVGEFKRVMEDATHSPIEALCKSDKSLCYTDNTKSKSYFCTLNRTDGDDSLPINCVNWNHAAEYCKSVGKQLPTEIQWEFAARNGGQETHHPWGNEPPRCNDAVVGRGNEVWHDNIECYSLGDDIGVGSQLSIHSAGIGFGQDKTTAGVLHLAGNLSEWTRSEFSTYGVSDEYWIHQGPLWEFTRDKDPEVITDDGKTKLVVRGGSWRDSLQSTWSSLRNSARSAVSVPRPELGFRCVKEFP